MAVTPWFQRELARVTREKWTVHPGEKGTSVSCQHGMKVFVAHIPGLDRLFLNHDAERHFVGKVLPAHRPWAEVRVRWPQVA